MPQHLLDEILFILHSVKEDKAKLEKIHSFLMGEIYEGPAGANIPEKIKPLIRDIAGSITAGMICFVNADTLEVEELPQALIEDPDEFESMTGGNIESRGMKHQEWENCIIIGPPESHESFKMMEGFVNEIEDKNLKGKLINALNRNRPYARFRKLIDDSDYRQDWFDYRQTRLEEYVYELLMDDIE